MNLQKKYVKLIDKVVDTCIQLAGTAHSAQARHPLKADLIERIQKAASSSSAEYCNVVPFGYIFISDKFERWMAAPSRPVEDDVASMECLSLARIEAIKHIQRFERRVMAEHTRRFAAQLRDIAEFRAATGDLFANLSDTALTLELANMPSHAKAQCLYNGLINRLKKRFSTMDALGTHRDRHRLIEKFLNEHDALVAGPAAQKLFIAAISREDLSQVFSSWSNGPQGPREGAQLVLDALEGTLEGELVRMQTKFEEMAA